MIGGRRSTSAIAAGLVWLALFSLLYTLGDEIGTWPHLPPDSFQGVDLVVGFAGAIALLSALALPGLDGSRFG
ncbi:MAG TPA: hypothetical protein VGA31_09900 [Thermoanaerobaculia bacterium]